MITAPPTDRALNGTTTDSCKENFQWQTSRVRLVGPKTMVSGSDSQTSPEVVDDSPDGGWQAEGHPEGGDASHEGNTEDKENLGYLSDAALKL